jgi:branched-chain amino acid aminotransferase
MTTKIAIDGAIHDDVTAKISVLDRGFLYGDSVYEVVRTYTGVPFALEEHLERLERSADLLSILLPLGREALVREIEEVLAAAGNAESYVRVIITRGGGPIGLDPALATAPCRVVIVTELHALPEELYERGASILLVAGGRAAEGAVPMGAKSGNYLVNIMALGAARRKGAQEAVLLDAGGRITEGASSNIFAFVQSRLCTPPLSVGILEGITRRKIVALANQIGLEIEERELRPEDLRRAAEIFLTGTIREVLPVTRVDDWRVGDGRPGPVTKNLLALFRAQTRRSQL